MTGERFTTRSADEVPMSSSLLNAALSYRGIRFFERETGTSTASLELAELSGAERKGNTAKLEPKIRSIVTNESLDQPFGLAAQGPSE